MYMKTPRFLAVATILFAVLPLVAQASVFQVGQAVTIPKEQYEPQNMYLAGREVTVLTTAQKDLVAGGGDVIVNGPVYGSVLAAGGTVNVLQDVQGSVRVAGGQVAVSGHVGGDILAAGGTVTVLSGSVVSGDVIAMGGTVDIEGTVNGQVHVYGGTVTINGLVGGAATVKAMKALTFGEHAVMGGTLEYTAPKEATIASGAKLGDKVTFTSSGKEAQSIRTGFAAGLFAVLGFLIIVKAIATAITALAAAWAFPKVAFALSNEFVEHFWKAVLTGFITLIVIPVACLVLALTAIGIYFALVLLLLYVLSLIVAGVTMCIFTGALLSKWIMKSLTVDWKWILLGTLVVFLVWLVPFVGWIVDLVLFLAALGVVIMNLRRDVEAKM